MDPRVGASGRYDLILGLDWYSIVIWLAGIIMLVWDGRARKKVQHYLSELRKATSR